MQQYPGFAKVQTSSESLTSKEIAEQQATKGGKHQYHILNMESLDSSKNRSKPFIRGAQRTACDFNFTDESDNVELCITHSKSPNNSHVFVRCDDDSDNTVSKNRKKRYALHNSRNQVKWWRNNITATMERFEPTQSNRPTTSEPPLDYGFVASVVTTASEFPSTSEITHAPTMSSMEEARSINSIYSYAYYEPGAVNSYSNVPPVNRQTANVKTKISNPIETHRCEQRNTLGALSKGFRSKSNKRQPATSLSFGERRCAYTTRYESTENLYEEVNDKKLKKPPSDSRVTLSEEDYLKEEIRRVELNHFRVLDELNLSLEALIMPPGPQNLSSSTAHDMEESAETIASGYNSTIQPVKTKTTLLQKPRRYGLLGGDSSSVCSLEKPNDLQQQHRPATSLVNLSPALQTIKLKDTAHNLCTNTEFEEADLDSGFSGSGSSSGTSYNDSLQNCKSGNTAIFTRNQEVPQTKNSCSSPTSSGVFTSKSSVASQEDSGISSVVYIANECGEDISPGSNQNILGEFDRQCSDTRHLSLKSIANGIFTGTKPKKNLWTMKP